MNSGLLLLSVMSLTFPMLLNATHQATHDTLDPVAVLYVSRVVAAMLLAVYCLYLFFQLYTHQHLYEDEAEADDDEEEAVLGVWGAILWLAVITVFIAFLSEYMVDAIEGAAHEVGVPDLFLGTIIIPIVGNAAEHAAAIIFAYKNKMELALGIAIGSSTQARPAHPPIRPPPPPPHHPPRRRAPPPPPDSAPPPVQIALFVIPLCIVIAWSRRPSPLARLPPVRVGRPPPHRPPRRLPRAERRVELAAGRDARHCVPRRLRRILRARRPRRAPG